MKKNTLRSFGALLTVFTVTVLMSGCSDMITTLLATTAAGADRAALTTNSLTFTSDDTFDAISESFTLPIAGENGSTITWVSNNTGVITIDNETGTATVTRPADADADVTLTATLTDAEGNTSTKTVTVTVLATTDAGNDAAALGTGDITFASGDSATAVTGGFTLPTTGEVNSSTITWVSGNIGVITVDSTTGTATVTRPATENVDVNLTATITDTDSKTSTKTIKVTVVAEGGTGGDSSGGSSATGILDDTFNASGATPGILIMSGIGVGGVGNEEGNSIALDPDGNILVAGNATHSLYGLDMALVRRDGDANQDSSFGPDGSITDGIGTNDDEGYSMALDSAGNILVVGYSNNGTDKDMAIWRYSSDGTPDTTFGSPNGYVIHDNAAGGSGDDYAISLALNESTGKIWVSGCSDGAGSNGGDMAIWCYNSDGSLDTTFDTDGFLTWDGSGAATSWEYGNSIVIDSEGKILVTGQSLNGHLGSDTQMAIWRYNSDGTLDATFGGDGGIVLHDDAAGGNHTDSGQAIVLDSNGKILIAGISHNGSDFDMAIWRYNSDGTLDTTFGGTGFVVHSNAAGGNGIDYGMDIALDSAGKILVTGFSSNGSDDDMVIWRYNSDGTPDTTFGSDGIITSHNAAAGSGNDWGKSIALDSEGRILVTGYSDSTSQGKQLVIWRYK